MNITSKKMPARIIFALVTLIIAGIMPIKAQQNLSYASPRTEQAVDDKFSDKKIVTKNPFASKNFAAAPALVTPPPGTHDWRGAYIGGHSGYGRGKADTRFEPLPSAAAFISMLPVTLRVRPRGALGGGQFGYNWQFQHVVFGAEASFSASNIKGSRTVTPIIQNNGTPFPGAGFETASQKIKWLGTLRPRLGVAFGRVLLYGTAGLAYGRVTYTATTDFRPAGTTQYPASFTSNRKGWTAGGGVEIAFRKRWSIKGEYLYYDLGNPTRTVSAIPSLPPFQVRYTWQTKLNTVVGGVNFHF